MLLPLLLNLWSGSSPIPPSPSSSDEAVTGGWAALALYDRVLRARDRRQSLRRIYDEDERREDAVEREIAQLLHEQELLDAERDERERLQELVMRFRSADGVPDRVIRAAQQAQGKATLGALEALGREIERARDEEDIAALMLLLNH